MKRNIALTVAAIIAVFVTTAKLYAQETTLSQTVSGVVTFDTGDPAVGVLVMVKGTNSRTVSDSDGKYSIEAPKNATLQFLFVGHTKLEIAIDNRREIDVTLQDEFSQGLQPAQPVELTAKQKEIAAADNSFAFRVFKKVREQEGENTFFSPLSLSMTLGMLNNGATGGTESEIADALGITQFSKTEVNEYHQKTLQTLQGIDPSADIAVANSIWYRNRCLTADSKKYLMTISGFPMFCKRHLLK